jgi:tetraacyldisaccharide 4'-kinase
VRWLLLPLNLLYGAGLFFRELYFFFSKAEKLPGFVISVGNIEAGGTGKTPVVIGIAAHFLQKNKTVGVLSRGYRSNLGRDEFAILRQGEILEGKKNLANADEGMMVSRTLPDCYVLLGRNRIRNAHLLTQKMKVHPDIWILDDGFQHRVIHRDLNVVLAHKLGVAPYNWIFPAGYLREPMGALKRADLILYRKDALGISKPQFKLLFHNGPILNTDGKSIPFEELKNIGVMTAIAHPDGFRRAVEDRGLNVVSFSYKSDHSPFLPEEVDPIFQKVDQIAITEKDFWRQPEFWKSYDSKVIRVTQHVDLPNDFLSFFENRK